MVASSGTFLSFGTLLLLGYAPCCFDIHPVPFGFMTNHVLCSEHGFHKIVFIVFYTNELFWSSGWLKCVGKHCFVCGEEWGRVVRRSGTIGITTISNTSDILVKHYNDVPCYRNTSDIFVNAL